MQKDWTHPILSSIGEMGRVVYHETDGIIIHGDSSKIVPSLMKGSVDLIIADSPWTYKQWQIDRINPGNQYHTMSDYEILKLLIICAKKLKKNSHFYMWITSPRRLEQDRIGMALSAFTGLEYKGELIWDKRPFFGTGSYFRNQVETALLFIKGNKTSMQKDVGNIQSGDTTGHSHKPVTVLEAMLQVSTIRGQVVLDPFLNDGRTAVVAKSMGRKFIGIEIDQSLAEAAAENVSQGLLFTVGGRS